MNSTIIGPMNLLDQTKTLLQSRVAEGVSLAEIAESSGKTVEREWLYKFARGVVDNPSITRIQKLHDHLIAFRQGNNAA